MKKTFTILMNKSFNQLFRLLLITTLLASFSQISTASPLCASSPTTFGYEYVSSVSINGQVRQGNTGYSGPGYMDYSSTSLTTMVAGNSYPVSVTVVTNTTWHEYVKIWFDFNGNQNLLDPGELIFDQNHTWAGVHTFSGNITVPNTAYNGDVYLRVIMVYAAVPQLCGSYSYGNTLDFKVNITGGVTPRTLSVSKAGSYQGNVTSTPAGINTAGGFNSANFADGSNVTLTATNVAGGKFTGWSGSVTGTNPTIVVPMNSNKNVVANFAADIPANLTSITAADNLLCLGETTQLTANGAVGTVYWYSGSCGGTLVGTGNSIQVSPTSNTTYYARNYNNGHYSANCASVSILVSTLDSDGDGIANDCDLDDDNDGILDTNECISSNFFWSNPPSISGTTATGTINGIGYTYTSSVNVRQTSNVFAHSTFPASFNVPNANPTIQNIEPSSNTLTFASPMTNPVLVFSSIGGGPIIVPINFSAPVEILWSNNTVHQISPTQITGQEGYAIVRMNGTFSSISFDYLVYENYVNFAFGADFFTFCDTDVDGTADYLDLDSDNDGCYDAIEGSLGLDPNSAPNGTLTGAVDSNGVPVLASAQGQEVGTSNNASANCFCDLGIDNTIPVVLANDITVYLDASGNASITPQAVDNGSSDNCGTVSLSLDDMTFDCSDMNAKNVATIVSDNTWSQSTVELTTPGQYVTVVNQLPNVNTYTLSASNAWPYGTVNFFSPAIPGAQPIYANGGTKFYRNDFQLTGRPQSLRIRARVDNMMEIFVNGVSIGMEDDVDGANFSNTIYHDVYIDDNGVQNGYLGGMQFDVVTSQSILDLLHEGSNEIVFAIANTNGTDQGGFMVRMDAVADGVPVVLTGVDPHGNSSNASAFVVVKDNLAPTIVTQPIILTLSASGTVTITANDVATVTDNCSVATVVLSQYVFGINDALNSPVTVLVTATDGSGNTSTQPVAVTVIDPAPVALCQDITVELDVNGLATITPEMVDNGSTSVVGIADITLDINSFDCSNIGANTVTLTVTSTLGSTATCNATVTVVDHIAPVITSCPGTIQVNNTPSVCGANVSFAAAASDNCTAVITYSIAPGSLFPVGLTTVLVTATDPSGNTATCSFDVEVIDTELPNISCPFDIVVNAAPGTCGALVNYETPTGTDNCGTTAPPTSLAGHTYKGIFNGHSYFLSNGAYPPETAHAMALASGGHLATISSSQENQFISGLYSDRMWIGYTDRDVEGTWRWITNEPVVYTNWSGGEPNNAGNEDWAVINWSGPTWNDWYYTQPAYYVIEFDGGTLPANLVAGLPSGSVFPVGNNVVTYEVVDPSGNRVECSFNVKVNDNQPPVALTNNLTIQLDVTGSAVITASQINNGSTDNCGIASISINKTTFDCSNVGANTVTLTVTDVNGNVSTASAIVTVEDNVAPVALAQDITIQLDASGVASITPEMIDAGSTDACGIASLALDITSFDCSNVGANTVILNVTDVNGNVSTASAIVTVQDVTPPVVLVVDITVQLDENGEVAFDIMDIDNGSYDVCGIQLSNAAQTPLTCDNFGPNEMTLVLTDIHGNSASATAIVTVEDNVAPIALAHNLTIQLDALGAASIAPEDIDNGSSDACGIASLAVSQSAFDCSNVGPNTVTLTVTDIHGNVSTVDAVVTVEDLVPAVVLTQNVVINLDEFGAGQTSATLVDNGSADACGIASMVLSKTDFDCSNVGDNTVTLTVTDVNGNVSSVDAVVTVEDLVPAVVLTQNVVINLDESGAGQTSATLIDNGSADACGIASMVLSKTDFDCSNVGENTVTLTVTDVNGNVSSNTAIVTVYDIIAPTITVPADVVQLNDALVCGAQIDLGEAITADNCTVASVVNDSPGFFPVGSTTVTWTVTDVNGNSTSATQQVTITNNLPVIDELAVDTNIEKDEVVTASATFTDNNVLYATFEWGDGSTSEGIISGQNITGDHIYTATGLYTVNLIIEDACGETTSMTYTYVVIWSACEGKLTAGGWMNYIPGNWLEYPALSGKATFEIEAQYKKHGGLEGKFNFEIKNKGSQLKLKSTSLDWLMINGNYAVVSGSAKVGNTYGYTFWVSVVDGGNGHHATGPNTIRVIIWDPSGNVIFDNEQGVALDQQPSTEIAKGSIQIHKKDNDCDDDYAHNDDDHGDNDDDDDDNGDNDDDHFKSCTIYPNPVDDDLNLKLDGFKGDHIYFTINDSKGSKYASKVKMNIYGGSGKTKVSQYKLRKGTYLITVQDKDGKNSKSMQFIKK